VKKALPVDKGDRSKSFLYAKESTSPARTYIFAGPLKNWRVYYCTERGLKRNARRKFKGTEAVDRAAAYQSFQQVRAGVLRQIWGSTWPIRRALEPRRKRRADEGIYFAKKAAELPRLKTTCRGLMESIKKGQAGALAALARNPKKAIQQAPHAGVDQLHTYFQKAGHEQTKG